MTRTRSSRLLGLLGPLGALVLVLVLVPGCDHFPSSLLEAGAGGPEASVDRGLEGGQRQDGPLKLDGPPKLDGPLKLDGVIAPPCAAGASQGQIYGATMVVCGGTAQINQCGAAALCNAAGAWSLCSSSQFLARGGKTTVTLKQGWLAACIRDNGAPMSPTGAICSSCMGSNLGAATVGWKCTGTKSDTKSGGHVGVATFFECRRLGVNTTAVEGYWQPHETVGILYSAVCCR